MFDKNLQTLLTPTITALGYEIIGVERLSRGRKGAQLIRIFIDKSDGITIKDCEAVSHQISGVLDVEDPVQGQYTLEVSSPGLDRPLVTQAHFARFIGHQVQIRLTRPLAERRNFSGTLLRIEDNEIVVLAEQTEYNLPYEQIDKAKLIPEI
ncbi:ribosome maturation factor RimP [Candidatus Albibeggiatoa sp. nov. BB20]|uniref:ribosome maturation factor RimP n=1 Tax=Candidatus Albibeggiatoa sp. nov. BB20 TaxID=3162723 RepID=UPI0033659172